MALSDTLGNISAIITSATKNLVDVKSAYNQLEGKDAYGQPLGYKNPYEPSISSDSILMIGVVAVVALLLYIAFKQ